MTDRAIVLYAHGARDPDWATPFQRVQALVANRLPQVPVELAFLEYMQPDLFTTMARLAVLAPRTVVVIPLFWGRGRHLKQDLPAVIERLRADYPTIDIRLTPAAGDAEAITQAVAEWAIACLAAGGTAPP